MRKGSERSRVAQVIAAALARNCPRELLACPSVRISIRRRGWVGWLAVAAMGTLSGSGDGEVRMQRPGGEGMREKWRQVMGE
jgi:hypothetical protein